MKQYAKYKDSGVEWIGKIPIEWSIWKLSHLANIYSGGTPDKSNPTYWSNGSIPWIASGEVNQEEIFQPTTLISKEGFENSSAKWIPKDSLVIALAGQGKTKGMVAYLRIETTGNQSLSAIVPKKVNSRYLFYWLKINYLNIRGLVGDEARDGLNLELIKNIKVPIPSQSEQIGIAKYLDKQTQRLNSLIEKRKIMIELLIEERSAIINHAVTKGINLKANMKESGVEWIGKIPELWAMTKIKYNTYVKGRIGWQGLNTSEFLETGPYLVTGTDLINGEINWETCYHVSIQRYEEDSNIQLNEWDLLITKDGTIGKVALVKKLPDKASLNSGLFVIRPLHKKYLTSFMYWLLNSIVFTEYILYNKIGSTIIHLYQETFENFYFALPPIIEQQQIVKHIEGETSKIDKTLFQIEKEIALIQEYKIALISEAVTGKIDVKSEGKYA